MYTLSIISVVITLLPFEFQKSTSPLLGFEIQNRTSLVGRRFLAANTKQHLIAKTLVPWAPPLSRLHKILSHHPKKEVL